MAPIPYSASSSSLPTNRTNMRTTGDREIYLALFVVEVLISMFGLMGNSLTCLAILGNKRLHVATNFYVLSLAFADLLVTGFLVPVRAAEHLAIFREATKPHAVMMEAAIFTGRATILASFANLAALSIDRYFALKFPIRYRLTFRHSTRLTLSVILGIWVVSVVLTSVPKYKGVSPLHGLIIFVIFVVIMTIIISVANWHVFKLVKQLTQRLQWYREKRGNTKDALVKSIHTEKMSVLEASHTSDSMDRLSDHNPPAGAHGHKSGSILRRFLSRQSQELKSNNKNCRTSSRGDDLERSSVDYLSQQSRSVCSEGSDYLHSSKLSSGKIAIREVTPSDGKAANLTNNTDTGSMRPGVNVQDSTGGYGMKCCANPFRRNYKEKNQNKEPRGNCVSSKKEQKNCDIKNGVRQLNGGTEFRGGSMPCHHSLPIDKTSENSQRDNTENKDKQVIDLMRKIGVCEGCDMFEYQSVLSGQKCTASERRNSPAIFVTQCDPDVQDGELDSDVHEETERLDTTCIEVAREHHEADTSVEEFRHTPRVSFSSIGSVSTNASCTHKEPKNRHGTNHRLRARMANKIKYARTNLDRRYSSITKLRFRRRKSPGLPSEEQLSDRLVAKTLALVIGLFVLLVYPRICLILYRVWWPESPSTRTARLWLKVLVYTNSIVNPFLYAWRLQEFRHEFKKIFKKCFGCFV